jgi:hypothetical protein
MILLLFFFRSIYAPRFRFSSVRVLALCDKYGLSQTKIASSLPSLQALNKRVLFGFLQGSVEIVGLTIKPEASERVHWTKVLVIPKSNGGLHLFVTCFVRLQSAGKESRITK